MTRRMLGLGEGSFFDDPMYDAYPGMYGAGMDYGFVDPARPHDRKLLEAMYAYWSNNDRTAMQYLADAYNAHVRKDEERPLIPPPSYI